MRTTVVISDALFHAAKVRAAERGETLKELFARAVEREIAPQRLSAGQRVSLPLIAQGGEPTIDITHDDIAAALTQDDARYARPR
jgi:hypothetical protein